MLLCINILTALLAIMPFFLIFPEPAEFNGVYRLIVELPILCPAGPEYGSPEYKIRHLMKVLSRRNSYCLKYSIHLVDARLRPKISRAVDREHVPLLYTVKLILIHI